MDITEFSLESPLVQQYAIEGDGLPDDAPASDVINTPERVVVLDTFLRKHHDTFSEHDLEVMTGLSIDTIRDIVIDFQNKGIIELEDSLYTIANMTDLATSLRELQIEVERGE